MNISYIIKTHRHIFLFLLIGFNSFSQSQNLTVFQDSKFESLLNEKRKINPSIIVNDRYKIQIYNGDNESCKKNLIEFKKSFKDIDVTIVFFTPIYKVWIGNYKTRIEAEKMLLDLKKKYPNAFLIKANK